MWYVQKLVQRQLMTVMLVVIALSAAQARIGQTSDQVIQDAGREKAVSVQWVESLGRTTMLRVQYHDDVILHLFGSDGREIAFYYYATKGLKPEDVDNIQRVYHTTWRGMGNDGGVFSWESVNGLHMTAERLEGYDYLAIFDMSRVHELPEIRRASPAPPSVVVATPSPATPAAVFDKPTVAATPDEKDCLLVATEAYARMQKTADWSKIAGFVWLQNKKKIGGHAVVFYQPTQNSNVWMYDKSGSYEIHTKSHDLNEIIAVLNQTLRTVNIKIESPRWLENNDSKNDFASTQSNQQPIWSAILDDEKTQSAIEPALVWRIIVGVIVAGVAVFLSGIVCIAMWIVTLVLTRSGWTWKKRTSSSSIARKTDEAQVSELHAICDDPVERALERVRRKKPITT